MESFISPRNNEPPSAALLATTKGTNHLHPVRLAIYKFNSRRIKGYSKTSTMRIMKKVPGSKMIAGPAIRDKNKRWKSPTNWIARLATTL